MGDSLLALTDEPLRGFTCARSFRVCKALEFFQIVSHIAPRSVQWILRRDAQRCRVFDHFLVFVVIHYSLSLRERGARGGKT